MALKGNKNSNTVTMFRSTSRITTPSFISVENGTTYYTPALTSRSQTIGDYIYFASDPTFVGVKNNTTYYAARARITAYDIPAGTYTPTTFKSLIETYMSVGATRTCANSFTVTLNRVTTTIPAQSVIYYSSFTSGITARLVGFGNNPNSYYYHNQVDRSKTTIYCVWCTSSTSNFYGGYTSYTITIGTGIKFN